MQRVAARKNAPGFPEALAVSNSILIPVVPHILHVVVVFEDIEHLFHVGDILGIFQLLIVLRHHFDLRGLELVALVLERLGHVVKISRVGVDREAALFRLEVGSFTFTALDVGQGQCLIYTADGETSVVDCGGAQDESGELAARYLETNGVFCVDRLILTHLDADHCNGAAQLLSRIRVDTLYLPLTAIGEDGAMLRGIREAAREAGTQIKFVREDTEFLAKDGCITILGPDLRESGNNGGLCVLASHEKYDILITGDLSQNAEYRLLSRYDLQDVELLVAGHHGAATSTSDALLQRTGASSVVISVGRDNSYGHPAADTLARIQNTGAAIYRTDELGTIVIRGGTYGKETGGGSGR